ncbi:MAG: hypothetical protein CSA18_02815 [Deltaproteobacteria bacterium]|nr:MAG: hypothetical protein CSA18_02815 [Deltaproteobacteria bacterium]
MVGKRKKNVESLIAELIEEYNIYSKKDFEKLNKRLSNIENLLKQIILVSSYDGANFTGKSKRGRKVTAAEMVFNIINREDVPVNFRFLKDKTGFNDKKLRNIIFRLHATGKIKRVERGCYLPLIKKSE